MRRFPLLRGTLATFNATAIAVALVATTSGGRLAGQTASGRGSAGQPTASAQQSDQHWIATWGTALLNYRVPPRPPAAAETTAATPAAPGVANVPATIATPATATPPTAAAAPTPAAGRGPGVDPRRRFPIPPSIPRLRDQTVRMIVRTSVGGTTLRVRLAHAAGAPAVVIGAAHVGLRAKGSALADGSGRSLTFSGKPTATLHGGQVLVSDPVALAVAPLSDLAVSVYLPRDTGPPTNHVFGLRPTYVSDEGNVAAAPALPEATTTMVESYYWLAGVDVLAPSGEAGSTREAGAPAGTLVTFGDSITDGDQSTPDGVATWPALLAARLQAHPATRRIGVVNAGISGNRLIGDNTSGLARLIEHALSVPGVRWITLLEGINDITAATWRPGDAPRGGAAATTDTTTTTAPPATASISAAAAPPSLTVDDLIAAYRQVIAMAHLHGVKVIGGTLTPYGESRGFTAEGEAIRQAVNAWIRTSGAFDAVIDFDAAVRDPRQPSRFRPEADSPDMLHPGDAGYRLMAESIDLKIFQATVATPSHRRIAAGR